MRDGFRSSLAVVLKGLGLLVMKSGTIRAGVCELFRGAMYMSAERERKELHVMANIGSQPSKCLPC